MKRSRCLTCFVRGSARGIGPGATEESVVLVMQEDALAVSGYVFGLARATWGG